MFEDVVVTFRFFSKISFRIDFIENISPDASEIFATDLSLYFSTIGEERLKESLLNEKRERRMKEEGEEKKSFLDFR